MRGRGGGELRLDLSSLLQFRLFIENLATVNKNSAVEKRLNLQMNEFFKEIQDTDFMIYKPCDKQVYCNRVLDFSNFCPVIIISHRMGIWKE